MAVNEGKYVDRPISEDEENLLDEIWDSLPLVEDEGQMLDRYYRDVRQRIHRHTLRRYAVYISSAVAVCLLALLFYPESSGTSAVFAQLNDMGVSVCEQKVQLMIGDSAVVSLDTSVKMKVGLNAKMTLLSAAGEKIVLKEKKPLKIYVPAGKRFHLELADGTHVWLNSDTWFEYPMRFPAAGERRVKIDGEGFFDVKPDAARPFRVETAAGESVRVLGTSFNISAYADDAENITTLVTGKIEYSVSTQSVPVVLLPNEQIRVNKTTQEVFKNEVNASEFLMWKQGMLYFNDEKLSVLAKQFARMYGIEIRVADRHKDACFSGMIRYERGIEYITKLLAETGDIRCSVEDGIMYLR